MTIIAVDRYLDAGRLRGFFAVYTETPVVYLLLFMSQAFWCALPFVVFAWATRRLFTASATEAAAAFLPRRTGVIVAGVGALGLLSWTQAVAWKGYFTSPSGSFGIAVALGLPSLLALVAMPALYGLGWTADNVFRRSFFALVLSAAAAMTAEVAGAATPGPCDGVPGAPGTALATELVAGGFTHPVHVASPPRDFDRLFVVEQAGTIRIIKSGRTLSKPFLDIRNRVRSGGERGLLSIAFHPSYAANRRFFVYYTEGTGDLVIAEFAATPADPDVADPAGERRLLTIPHRKYGNHNGGQLAFGPDRFLYIGTGDGGAGGDPDDHGQTRTSLLGKLLRIDVDRPDRGVPYGVPESNPFVREKSGAPEVWAYGLRNPWRFSFDRGTGDLYIADVGQNAWEEVNVQPASSKGGENYGWRYLEGAHCYDPPAGCPTRGMTMPVVEYPHQVGGQSITGGFVYRGCRMPDLHGTYIFSDYVKGFIGTFVLANGKATQLREITQELAPPPPRSIRHISSFGEDARGELYLLEHHNGEVYRLIPRP
jgi:glucose/arabinose dehydrogenase